MLDEQGLMMEGYRATPYKSVAFKFLAASLVQNKKEKELALC